MKIAPGHIWKIISILALVAPLAVGLAGPEHRDSGSSTTSSNAQAQYSQALDKVGKTGEWKDPETVLANVVFDNLPITEVGASLKDLFNNEFDIILPFGSTEARWSDTSVVLRLKNVKASEIFNAMNLVFETTNTHLRWELMMNGRRPTALLRILPEPTPILYIDPVTGLPVSSKPAPPERPMVFFVGDLVGDPKSGGMTMDELVETVSDVCKFALSGDHLSSHKQTQLLIVRGTDADISFVQSTLGALRDKVRLDEERSRQRTGDAKAAGPKIETNGKAP